MAEDREKNRWVVPLEMLGVVTASIFATSGFINALAFQAAWDLNYFAIANTTDIVMNGFLIFGVLLAIAFGSLFASAIILAFMSIFPKSLHIRYRKWLRISFEVDVFSRANIFIIFAISVMTLTATLLTNFGLSSDVYKFVGMPDKVPPHAQFSYATGLKVAPRSSTPPDCLGQPVLWMGSSAAIVGCRQGVRVLHSLDGLITEPLKVPRTNKDYLPPKTA